MECAAQPATVRESDARAAHSEVPSLLSSRNVQAGAHYSWRGARHRFGLQLRTGGFDQTLLPIHPYKPAPPRSMRIVLGWFGAASLAARPPKIRDVLEGCGKASRCSSYSPAAQRRDIR